MDTDEMTLVLEVMEGEEATPGEAARWRTEVAVNADLESCLGRQLFLHRALRALFGTSEGQAVLAKHGKVAKVA